MTERKKIVVKVNCAVSPTSLESIEIQEPELEWRYDRIVAVSALLLVFIAGGIRFFKHDKAEISNHVSELQPSPESNRLPVRENLTEAASKQDAVNSPNSKQPSVSAPLDHPFVKPAPIIKKSAAKVVAKPAKKSNSKNRPKRKNK